MPVVLFFLIFLSSSIAILCMAILFVRIFLLVVTVQYHSMSPTLEHGDRVLALRHLPRSWLRKGQIVLVWPVPGIRIPVPPSYKEPPYIKRIVAVSGETYTRPSSEVALQYRHPGAVPALFSDEQAWSWVSLNHPEAWDIPPAHVFVRGDSRQASVDSTVWGPVPFRNILAVVLMKLPRTTEGFHETHDNNRSGTSRREI